jgi:hypothetical protein
MVDWRISFLSSTRGFLGDVAIEGCLGRGKATEKGIERVVEKARAREHSYVAERRAGRLRDSSDIAITAGTGRQTTWRNAQVQFLSFEVIVILSWNAAFLCLLTWLGLLAHH